MEGKSIFNSSGAPSSRSMIKSLVLHVVVLLLMLLVPTRAVLRSEPPKRELDIVFHRPPVVEIPVPVVKMPPRTATIAAGGAPAGAPAPAVNPRPNMPDGPDGPGRPDLPPGPEEGVAAVKEKVGKAGILAFKDK